MKYISMVVVAVISFSGLNAMVPDVTKWQEICKNPEEKKQLITVYQDFCQKRIKNNVMWTVGSLIPFAPYVFKSARQALAEHPQLAIFYGWVPLWQTYFLGRNAYRNSLADQEDLCYLNHDVLEQLGNPRYVKHDNSTFPVMCFEKTDDCVKDIFGRYHSSRVLKQYDLSVDNVSGIKKALSGECKAKRIQTPCEIDL